MNKKIILMPLIIAAVILSGCGKKQAETSQDKIQDQKPEKGMIATIADAMKSGKKMKCTYKFKIAEKEMESIGYFEGKKYRSENTINNVKHVAIVNDEAMYSWSEGEKKGFKLTNKCSDELKVKKEEIENKDKPQPGSESATSQNDNFDKAMDVKCEEVSSIDFSLPADVVFEDQCENMKNMQKQAEEMMKKYQNQMPANAPSAPNIPPGVGRE